MEDCPAGEAGPQSLLLTPVTPITNIQKQQVLSRLEAQVNLKQTHKSKINTLLCREIFENKQTMNRQMREKEHCSKKMI